VHDGLLHDGAYLHFPFRKHDDENELMCDYYEPRNTRVCEAIVGKGNRLRCIGNVELWNSYIDWVMKLALAARLQKSIIMPAYYTRLKASHLRPKVIWCQWPLVKRVH
jgi:hypothetical protein